MKRMIAFFCVVLLVLGFGSTIAFAGTTDETPKNTVAGENLPDGGTSVLNWDTYYDNSAANSASYCKVTKVTDGSGKYVKYIRTQVTNSCSTNQCSLNFKDTDGTLGLTGKVKEGDVLLLHFIARGVSEDDDAANYYIQLLDSTTKTSAGKTSSRTLSENWTEVYIPVTALEAVGALYVRIGQSTLQYVDIAYMEVINYKTTVAASDLPDRAIDLEAGEKSEVIEGQKVNFLNTFSGSTVETGLTAYPNAKTFKKYTHTFTQEAVGDIATDDVLMFSLVVKASSACTALDVTISADTGASMTYYVPVQWTLINIPVDGSGLSKIKLAADSIIMIADAAFENHGAADVLSLGQKSGMYLLEDYSYYALSESGAGATRTIQHTSGSWQTVTAATYLKEGLEKQWCTVCGKELDSHIVPALQGTDVAKVFSDIKTTDWFYKNDSIYYVYNAGLFKGMTETEFKPSTAMNRGMFVTVLGRLHGVNADNIVYKNTFSDVADGKYYSRYVIWAADNGIVTGTSATTFAPSKNVTREQICAMMVRYCNYAGIELKAVNAANNFSDAGSISNYAKAAVTTRQMAGLVSGKGDNKFDPKGNAKRSEVATILLNFSKNYL